VVSAVAASLLADVIWHGLGRRRGSQVLRLPCRISLEPDSCVRRTEDVFLRYPHQPEALKEHLESGEPIVIVDLRSELDARAVPWIILRMAPEELGGRHREIPQDRDIVLYCS
jgi:hypothetical protein